MSPPNYALGQSEAPEFDALAHEWRQFQALWEKITRGWPTVTEQQALKWHTQMGDLIVALGAIYTTRKVDRVLRHRCREAHTNVDAARNTLKLAGAAKDQAKALVSQTGELPISQMTRSIDKAVQRYQDSLTQALKGQYHIQQAFKWAPDNLNSVGVAIPTRGELEKQLAQLVVLYETIARGYGAATFVDVDEWLEPLIPMAIGLGRLVAFKQHHRLFLGSVPQVWYNIEQARAELVYSRLLFDMFVLLPGRYDDRLLHSLGQSVQWLLEARQQFTLS